MRSNWKNVPTNMIALSKYTKGLNPWFFGTNHSHQAPAFGDMGQASTVTNQKQNNTAYSIDSISCYKNALFSSINSAMSCPGLKELQASERVMFYQSFFVNTSCVKSVYTMEQYKIFF